MQATFRSKNAAVYEMLREAIIRGEYAPGSRLVIDDLAASLGVSQIPIREAVRQLDADGFVIIEPYVGVTVTEINANFIFEVFALLESLERIASRAAARCISDEQLEKLAALIHQMDSSVHDPERWSQENKQLHLFICDCAQTELVSKMMHKVLDHWDRLRLHYLKDVSALRIPLAQEEHKLILAAFQTRDPDQVEQAIRKHNHSASSSYREHLKTTGQLGTDEDCP